MSYDPVRLGARCNQCLLSLPQFRAGGPVPPKRFGASIALVGEAPGETEVERGEPFVGDSGKELVASLAATGVRRNDVDWFNAVACQPATIGGQKNNMAAVEAKTSKANRKLIAQIAAGELPDDTLLWLTPLKACRPRLLRELFEEGKPHQDIILTGKMAYHAVQGTPASILDVRGGMLDGWITEHSYIDADGVFTHTPPSENAKRVRLLPTVHPAFVMRARRWTRAFRSDLARAVRWFRGIEEWVPPRVTYQPSPDWLEAWIAARSEITYDTETDGIEPLLAKLRCVSLGDAEEGVVVPFLSVDGVSRFYTAPDERRIISILRDYFINPRIIKYGWNAGSYDRPIIERHFGVTPRPLVDGILLSAVVESELPHSLAYAASMRAGMSPAWKATRTAKNAKDDRTLHVYAGMDAVQNHRVMDPLATEVRAMEQGRILKCLQGLQSVAANMHRIGLRIDVTRRNEWERLLLHGGVDPKKQRDYDAKVAAGKAGDEAPPKHERGAVPTQTESTEYPSYLTEIRARAGRAGFNPASVLQVRDLLYSSWKLPIPNGANGKPKVTKNGDPSTDDETIRALLIHPLTACQGCDYDWAKGVARGRVCTNCEHRLFLEALRRYRARMKLWGTYIKRFVPMTVAFEASVFDSEVCTYVGAQRIAADPLNEAINRDVDEYEEMERAAKDLRSQKEKVKGYIWPDGRVRPNYSAHATAVSRLAGSGPNELNRPSDLKDMIIPNEGNVFVGADSAQIHLRIAASRWNLTAYLRALDAGADPHSMTALLVFGEDFRRADGFPGGRWDGDFFIPNGQGKWKGQAKKFRDLAKRVQYASQYMATVETVYRVIKESEDANGKLLYPDLELPSVRKMHDAWLSGVPEIRAGWEAEIQAFRRQGYIAEPILGRRRYFLDGENPNEIVNFSILAAEGAIMSRATVNVARVLGYDHERFHGMVHQNYDSMCVEAPDEPAAIEKVRNTINAEMNFEDPNLPNVRFEGDVAVGRNLKEA